MGIWDVKIESNDTFQDIYQSFFERYNRGEIPADISLIILNDFRESFNDIDDQHNSLFALALAQWETKSLDVSIFDRVRNIIKSDADIKVWKELGGDEKLLKKRTRFIFK